ncbi:PKD domain-containing protein [Natrarchaeobius halalkaliphilus]|uniref:PKD domain-containing protein n=1 Tax=Natrarchaeobius halalkaliphilus TaxID=1679091 RepID=A0A3N6LMD1_9EURY|nr:PKD domain-containing protein [Natrarchaeobius halalkaliphilus]RQG86675.1 PKD domain-containing protein [Natrarchaeobius halalkaliphilus]
MKRTRRNVLGTASSMTALLFGASASTAARDYPEWDPDEVYNSGDRVVYEGSVWEAQWWTLGDEPSAGPGPWERLEEDANDDENDDENDGNGGNDSEYPSWNADTVYTGGDRVVYDGYLWEANWWTQGDEPGESEWGPWEEIEEYDDGDEDDDDNGDDDVLAGFSVSDSNPDPGEEVEFDAADSGGEIESYDWELGDDTEATGEVVIHTYDEDGDYEVELTVTDVDGATDTDSTTVTVADEPDSDLTADTALEEFYAEFDRDFYPEETEGGVPGLLENELHEDASEHGADLDAIENDAGDGSMELGALGDRGLELVKHFDDVGVARANTARLVAWLAGLAEETEPIPFNDGSGRGGGLTADAGPVAATNDPSVFVQNAWPLGEDFDDVYHQSQREDWSSGVSDDQYTNVENPIIDAAVNKVHPLTGESLGNGFSANAPLEATAELHGDGWQFDTALIFENTTDVPLLIDGAVIWWVGPSKGGTGLDQFSYDNAQRKNFSVGHPQRDVIEVALPDESKPGSFEGTDAPLSAYGVRMAQHNNPYMYRTLYPNQKFSMTYGNVTGPDQYDWPREDLLEVMLDTCHVEFRDDMDDIEQNTELVETLDMKNRFGN